MLTEKFILRLLLMTPSVFVDTNTVRMCVFVCIGQPGHWVQTLARPHLSKIQNTPKIVSSNQSLSVLLTPLETTVIGLYLTKGQFT